VVLSISSLLVCLIADHPEKEEAMKYMILIYQGTTPLPGSAGWERLSEDEKNEIYAAYKLLNETPGMTAGLGLTSPELATTVRVQDGKTLTTDGPFVELKEAIGGYFLLDAEDLDAVIEVVSRIPAASMGGAIEIRPVAHW
jgi:hypothetical protein